MSKEGFEVFMKAGEDPVAFGLALDTAVKEEAEVERKPNEFLVHDDHGLVRLGFAVARELGRTISISREEFMYTPPYTNQFVPYWVDKLNPLLLEMSEDDAVKSLYDPNTVTLADESAIETAISCVHNGKAAVRDANLAARSIERFVDSIGKSDDKIPILRASTGLIVRLGSLDELEGKGKSQFEKFVGIESGDVDAIDHDKLVFIEEKGAVDLSPEALEEFKKCSGGDGCPALRMKAVRHGATIPMFLAFWAACVDVIEMRAA
jgi:hypothetical protein